MGTYIPRIRESYMFPSRNGRVGRHPWDGDEIDLKIFRTIGAWSPKENGIARLQSMVLRAITTSSVGHWSDLDHKTFWGWVDDYELHT